MEGQGFLLSQIVRRILWRSLLDFRCDNSKKSSAKSTGSGEKSVFGCVLVLSWLWGPLGTHDWVQIFDGCFVHTVPDVSFFNLAFLPGSIAVFLHFRGNGVDDTVCFKHVSLRAH